MSDLRQASCTMHPPTRGEPLEGYLANSLLNLCTLPFVIDHRYERYEETSWRSCRIIIMASPEYRLNVIVISARRTGIQQTIQPILLTPGLGLGRQPEWMTTPDHQPPSIFPGLPDSARAVVWPVDIAESGEAQDYTSVGYSSLNDTARGH